MNKSAQVAIESTLAIVAIFIFLLGIMQIFLWFNRSMISRQKAYQRTRTHLGKPQEQVLVDFYHADSAENRLYVFPEEAGGGLPFRPRP